MKLQTLGMGLAATAIAGSAFAADLPSHKVAPAYVPPSPIMTWTGFYIGLNAGYTWSNSSTNVSSVPVYQNAALSDFGISQLNNITRGGSGVLGLNRNGFIGGGQIGWNWQSGELLAGIEADIQDVAGNDGTGSLSSSLPTSIAGTNTDSSITTTGKLNYLGTLRGRVGYLVTPAALLYATGGLAYGGVSSTTTISQFPQVPPSDVTPGFASTGSDSSTRLGWTAGAGVEYKFAPNWSAKLEYLYYDLGTVSYSAGVRAVATNGGIPTWTHESAASSSYRGNIVRVGMNYSFDW